MVSPEIEDAMTAISQLNEERKTLRSQEINARARLVQATRDLQQISTRRSQINNEVEGHRRRVARAKMFER